MGISLCIEDIIMTRSDRFLRGTIRSLLALALIGACLLCEAALMLGYVDYLFAWIVGALSGGR
jgi:hypothetical protein